MTDVTVTEVKTVPSESYVSSFFSKLPTDSRFTKVAYAKIVPDNGINNTSDTITFIFNQLSSPSVYLMSDMLMSATVVITKKDRVTMPDTAANVAPVNCSLSSLFSSCAMKINDIQVTEGAEYYPYKCYLSQTMTYSTDAKITQLLVGGYESDTVSVDAARNIEPSVNNYGYMIRSRWFRTGRQAGQAYKPEGTTFLGKFQHELSGSSKPIPPGVKVSFELKRSPAKFYLMRCPAAGTPNIPDTEEYEANLMSCNLYVKVAQMVQPIFDSLEHRFKTENIFFHYRKVTVKKYIINGESQTFEYNNLFPDSEAPVKVHFVICETSAIEGNYDKNPFGFYRTWKIPAGDEVSQSSKIFSKFRENQIQQQFDFHRRQLDEMRKEQQKERKEREKERKESKKLRQLLEQLTKGPIQSTSTVLPIPTANETGGSLGENEQNDLTQDSSKVDPPNNPENTHSRKKKLGDPSKKGKCGKVLKKRKKQVDPTYSPDNESDSGSDSSDIESTENDEDGQEETFHSVRGNSLPPTLANTDHAPLILPLNPLENFGAAGDIAYVRSLTLDVVSDKIDALDMINPQDECVFDFVRMQTTNGFMNHVQSNSITYERYGHGWYICAFDLSTSNQGANSQYSIPATRSGVLKVTINFSQPTKRDLSLLMFGESTGKYVIPININFTLYEPLYSNVQQHL